MAALAVALAPLVYFLPAVLSGVVLCPHDGLIFNTPLRVAAAEIVLGGSAPLWNPYIFGGMPLLGSAQGGLLFPPNWFYLALPAAAATNAMVVSSYVIAALGAYLYARRGGASIAGAVVTSLVWQCGGFLVAQLSHINIVQTAAMLPWVLWALDGYGAGGGRKWGVLLAVFVALQCFVGHQQTFAYSLLLAAAYAASNGFASEGRVRSRYVWSLAFLAAGVCLAAVQILPTFELLRNSPRADASYEFFTSFSMPRRFLMSFFAPYVMGGGDGRLFRAHYVGPAFYAEYVAYVGLLTVMLAALALLLKRDARTKFWAAAAFVCLALALGHKAPLGLYKLIYHVPVLNLFRVPARHLMEVEFALAVLAGRGLTALGASRGHGRSLRLVASVGACVLVLTCLVVTVGRPADFKLGREAPVSLMRAPELFLPIVLAGLTAWALWVYARGRARGAVVWPLCLLVIDLTLWGQSSGWGVYSPRAGDEYWREPETVKRLRELARENPAPHRILTASRSDDTVLWMQPDIYMMHGIENAAGYDGFGLARYGRLAGDMTVWGELSDPARTLRGPGRELDLLNVRYVLTPRGKGAALSHAAAGATTPAASSPSPSPSSDSSPTDSTVSPAPTSSSSAASSLPAGATFPAATKEFGGVLFAETDLGIPNIGAGKRLTFVVPPVEVERVAVVTNLSWSEAVPDGATVGRVRLREAGGRVFEFALRAGADTAEWAYDRADIRARIKHGRPALATSYTVEDAQGKYEGHTYVASFALPSRAVITGGEIVAERDARWPDLLLGLFRVSLSDGGNSYPLRREWLSEGPAPDARRKASGDSGQKQTAAPAEKPAQPVLAGHAKAQGESAREAQPTGAAEGRWRLAAQTSDIDIYENARALPRAWLASDVRLLDERQMLDVIRTGKFSDGAEWNPLTTALVETPLDFAPAPRGGGARPRAEVAARGPNRVEVKTSADTPSVLVLCENHYPGWRAYVDGRAVETPRVNFNLRGVALTAGEHAVEFVYRPKSVLYGLALSLLTLAALLLWSLRVLTGVAPARLSARRAARAGGAEEARPRDRGLS